MGKSLRFTFVSTIPSCLLIGRPTKILNNLLRRENSVVCSEKEDVVAAWFELRSSGLICDSFVFSFPLDLNKITKIHPMLCMLMDTNIGIRSGGRSVGKL